MRADIQSSSSIPLKSNGNMRQSLCQQVATFSSPLTGRRGQLCVADYLIATADTARGGHEQTYLSVMQANQTGVHG
jgi:hypothetical protein